jgi:AhpD family alkylhydroperoxidase
VTTTVTPFGIAAHHPWIMQGMGMFELALQRGSRLDPRLKELARAKAAETVGCRWCMDFGKALGKASGFSDDDLAQLGSYRESGNYTELEKLAMEYAELLSVTPPSVPDELFERLRKELDDRQLVELTATITWENSVARFNTAMGIEPQGFSDGG